MPSALDMAADNAALSAAVMWSAPFIHNANSSPPRRATRSLGRTVLRSISAVLIST